MIDHPLRIGLSMEATADLSDPGILVPASSKGSPNYTTTIFQKEELGDIKRIDTIIAENADPALSEFFTKPLTLGE